MIVLFELFVVFGFKIIDFYFLNLITCFYLSVNPHSLTFPHWRNQTQNPSVHSTGDMMSISSGGLYFLEILVSVLRIPEIEVRTRYLNCEWLAITCLSHIHSCIKRNYSCGNPIKCQLDNPFLDTCPYDIEFMDNKVTLLNVNIAQTMCVLCN